MTEQQPDIADREPVDPDVVPKLEPDVDLRLARRVRHRADDLTVLGVIALGGALGASARYLAGQAWPTPTGSFPLTTLGVNVLGSALIGILMVLVTDVWTTRRLARPFLGTGVLGGFTTFSTWTVDLTRLTTGHHPAVAVVDLVAAPVCALLAVWATASATRALVNWRMQ